ncbi:hypothetical protein C9994_11090 [Marivirga lumbricoides]|uniref:Tetratricopeptide repeat protein n=1 Tax=Marivirga lumbricoides TaxID=1046115 RepID=A0A2T4DP82_9BACT|nr:hypothetical protein C9994_11090 [Marivirga lumbricoides]
MIKMNKIVLAITLLVAFSTVGYSQTENTAKQEAIQRAKAKYSRSIQYNDFAIAKDAIYDLLVLEPSNFSYLDSLAYMYFEFRQYASAALVSRDALNRNPQNRMMLQIGAKSLSELGAIDQSLKMYEKLYTISDDAFVLFEIAQKQYDLKKYDEAMINTELLLGKPIVEGSQVYVNNASGEQIEAPFKAVVHNLQGLIARAQGNEESAKKYFNNALKLAPNYALAKENLNPKKE